MRSRLLRYALVGVACGATSATAIATSRTDNSLVLSFPTNEVNQLVKRVTQKLPLRSNSHPDIQDSLLSGDALSPTLLAASPAIPRPAPGNGSGDVCGAESVQKWDDNWDLRDPEFLGMTEFPTATRHLVLIRHGQYNLEPEDDAERKLTELGRRQLHLTGQRLKELSCQSNIKYDKIIVSNMTRALESADIIAESLPDVERELPGDALLREGAPYPPEPPNWNIAKSKEQTAKKLHNYFVDGPRIESAFRKYFRRASYEQKEDSTEIVVCHANVIRYFAMRALQLPPEAWLRISLKNGSITLISISPRGKVSLRALGDAGHMPPDCLTTT